MKRIKLYLWPILGLVSIVTIIIYILNDNSKSAAEEIKKEQELIEFVVTATYPKKTLAEVESSVRGQIESKSIFTLYSETEGKVIESSVIEGKNVKAGQSLISIDASSHITNLKIIEQSLRKAKLDFDYAQKQYNRHKALIENGNASLIEFENVKNQLESSEIELRTTEQQLELVKLQIKKTKVLAPETGVIVNKKVNIGDYVSTGTPLGTMVENKLIVNCFVPEKIAIQSNVNENVEIIVDALANLRLSGKIKAIIPNTNETQLYPIQIEIEKHNKLIPGMGVSIVFKNKEENQSLFIPRSAIVGDFKNPFVFIINSQNKPEKKEITTGKIIGNNIEIIEGITDKDIIVLSGQGNIEPGKILANFKIIK